MKIYAISIMAASEFTAADGEESGNLFLHMPGIAFAETMDRAADEARQRAFAAWPQYEGWKEHQAVIIPVTEAFYMAAASALRAGILDMAEEEGQTFKF